MPRLSFLDSLRQRRKSSVTSDILKASPILSVEEGEQIVLTYMSSADKMKIFSAFIREGVENNDKVDYTFPDEELETIRAKLKENGVDVEKYERKGALVLESLSEYYLLDGEFNKERNIKKSLDERAEAKRKGFRHYRDLEDLGDFSFLDGQWQKFIGFWDDPAWETPSGSNVEILDYSPFITELTVFNVEGMSKAQLDEIRKAFWIGNPAYIAFVDLLKDSNALSKFLGIPHKKLIGRKILLEFEPTCPYETVVDDFVKEAKANLCPIFVFTSPTSTVRASMTKHSTARFFLLSPSVSKPEAKSENEVFLPAKNTALVLDALNNILEENVYANVFLVFDKLSEIISLVGFDKASKFLLYVLDMLPQTKATAIFLLNKSAHEPKLVSQIRGLFHNLLTYKKDGLKVVKIS